MSLARIDELNNLRSEVKAFAKKKRLRDYFGVMVLPEEKISRRIEIADELFEITQQMYSKSQNLDLEDLEDYLYIFYLNRIFDVADKHQINVSEETLQRFAKEVVHTTVSNDSEWFTSKDRAFANAVDLANVIENENEYNTAIANGLSHKRWLTMLDERVRDTHSVMEGETIPINDLFNVGGYEMRYPLDGEYGASASEIAGCRCTVEYL